MSIFIMVIGLSGVQFGLLSYEWLKKKKRTTAEGETDLLITSVITDRIGRNEVLLPIHQHCVKFEKETRHRPYVFTKNSNSELGEMCDKNARTWRTLLKSGLWRPITFENFVIVLVNNSTAGSSSHSDRQIWYTSSDHRQNQQHSSVLLTLSP